MSTLRAVRESLVEASRRHSRVAHEVEDLAHDIFLSALRRGTQLESEAFLRGLHGAARRHGAFLARSEGRRRAREANEAREMHEASSLVERGEIGEGRDPSLVMGSPLSVLSPTLRTTLFLLCLGLDKAELRSVLGVSDAALRKRFQALREHGPLARPDLVTPSRTPALSRLRRSQVHVLLRLAIAPAGEDGAGERRVLAASDPDGHGIIFAEALTPGRATATTEEKGTPCSTPSSRTLPSSS